LYLRTGTTQVLLSSIASPLEQIEHSFECTSEFFSVQPEYRAAMAGLYIEGTFMKMPEFRGAHNPKYFFPPEMTIFERLQRAAGGTIKVVNVPPEHGSAGLELIRELRRQSIVVAAGHTGATCKEYLDAIAAGLTLAVHFLNGPTGSSTKPFHGGGAVEAILRADELYLELITDGFHVSEPYVRDTIARKGFEKTAVISDCMFMTGLNNSTAFNMFGIDGRVSADRTYLQVADREDTLFGSVLTMDRAFSNVLSWLTTPAAGIWREHRAIPFEDALLATSRMCSGVPAEVIGLPRTGHIAASMRADLLVAKIEETKSGYAIAPERIFLQGEETTSK
jgi:N-acetylglucosamine-6-phosphate deacetylase